MRLRVTQDEYHVPVVELEGIRLECALAPNGLEISYVDCGRIGGPSVPQVTLTFGPGKLELDLDVELLERLLAEAR